MSGVGARAVSIAQNQPDEYVRDFFAAACRYHHALMAPYVERHDGKPDVAAMRTALRETLEARREADIARARAERQARHRAAW